MLWSTLYCSIRWHSNCGIIIVCTMYMYCNLYCTVFMSQLSTMYAHTLSGFEFLCCIVPFARLSGRCLQKTKVDTRTKLDVTLVKTQCLMLTASKVDTGTVSILVFPGLFHQKNQARHSFGKGPGFKPNPTLEYCLPAMIGVSFSSIGIFCRIVSYFLPLHFNPFLK